ncbi:MAG: hypothetical protein KJ905_00580 [Nanoarchaeota archaeon]|nr:hypothetical protein [Nanoarchaeota archaeon]MBU1501256.1 hypothetical protein [Nanoarchaeota archaeon]MBU2458772.1 hypothetical protein [Nanoarchaeota archaeon]
MVSNTSNRSLIHVRFEYEEAVEARRDILFSQIVSLRIEKAIRGYGFYRMKELDLKAALYRKIKDVRMTITKLEKTLPKLEIPEIIEKKISGKPDSVEHIERDGGDGDIENQLKEIQKRLDHLQRDSMGL